MVYSFVRIFADKGSSLACLLKQNWLNLQLSFFFPLGHAVSLGRELSVSYFRTLITSLIGRLVAKQKMFWSILCMENMFPLFQISKHFEKYRLCVSLHANGINRNSIMYIFWSVVWRKLCTHELVHCDSLGYNAVFPCLHPPKPNHSLCSYFIG